MAWAPRPQATAFLQAGSETPPPWAPSLACPIELRNSMSYEPPGPSMETSSPSSFHPGLAAAAALPTWHLLKQVRLALVKQ